MNLLTQDTALVGNLKTCHGGAGLQVQSNTLAFGDATAKDLFKLPAGAIPIEIGVIVTTGFTDTGTDLVDIGKTGTGDFFVNDLDVAALGKKAPTVSNLGAVLAAETQVTGTFIGQNGNAGAGAALIYCVYFVP